jgi:tryptophanyl-tRNA synthetase
MGARRPQILSGVDEGTGGSNSADEIGDGGSSALKAIAATAVNDFLAPLRARRKTFAAEPDLVREILRAGNETANAVADATLTQVREAMGTTY